MVAKTPLKERRLAMALNPNIIREAVNKVDKCMARLQELQYTVTGGAKEVSGVRLSPQSTRGYMRTSLRCKQENLRINAAARKSPPGKFPVTTQNPSEWRRMSLPAMLLQETVLEILQTTKFAKQIIAITTSDPKTPDPTSRKRITRKIHCENTELRSKRISEKQTRAKYTNSPPRRARTRITFKSNSPPARNNVAANRISPKNKVWGKKTVLFPNPLFSSSSSPTNQRKFYKTRSPIIGRTERKTPHKFLVKSPSSSLKSQMKSKKVVVGPVVISPVKIQRRCSFSPSKMVSKLVSPLKQRFGTPVRMMSGLKQRPTTKFSTPVRSRRMF